MKPLNSQISLTILLSCLFLLTACSRPQPEPEPPEKEVQQPEEPKKPPFDLTGSWYADTGSGHQRAIEFKQDGYTVTGELDDGTLTGTIKENEVRFEMDGTDVVAVCSLEDGALVGTYSCPSEGIEDEDWSAVREADEEKE